MIYILIVLGIVVLESKIKKYVEDNKRLGESEEILGGKITIEKYHNSGMFLSFLQKKKELVKVVSGILLGALLLLFAIFLPQKGKKLFKLGLSLILGGAISNVSDRINRGYVVDYFSFKKPKNVVFNLADLFIFLGSLLITIASIFFAKSDSCTDETSE